MIVNGWTLLFHDALIRQLENLAEAAERARKASPETFASNTNVKLLATIGTLLLEVIPADPTKTEYRQGNTLGSDYRHWFRAKFSARFRLFFRYDSRAKLIVFAWVNDETTLRQSGGKRDPYAVFQKMLDGGDPPNTWDALVRRAKPLPGRIASALQSRPKR
jgi:toxin YhaV